MDIIYKSITSSFSSKGRPPPAARRRCARWCSRGAERRLCFTACLPVLPTLPIRPTPFQQSTAHAGQGARMLFLQPNATKNDT